MGVRVGLGWQSVTDLRKQMNQQPVPLFNNQAQERWHRSFSSEDQAEQGEEEEEEELLQETEA